MAGTAPNFRNIPFKKHIPVGWRLATVNDVQKFPREAREVVTLEWGISTLADGRIHGRGYNYKVNGYPADCAEKLIVQEETPWCIIQSNYSGLVLDIEGGTNGGKIITYTKHGGDNQLWTWKGNSLVSKTGYALDVKDGTNDSGTNAIAWNYHGGNNQQWRVEGDKIISEANGMALDIKDGKQSNADIILWPAVDGPSKNQSWQFVMHFN